ncbi:MAG: thiamine-phosphate kinase [Planctomycetota bacterium]|nr:thiamine-phosphate kinase [Planctomycetota bacterium]
MGELSLIEHFRAQAPGHPWLAVGPGQDCAILNWPGARDVAFKIDQVVEGTHFVLQGADAATGFQVGWKAMAKACSDIAATGFWPVAATAAVNLRKGTSETLAMDVYKGLCACCTRFAFALAGGDISVSENGLSVVVSLLGEGPKGGAWLRRGARVGDALLVTGTLGHSRRTRKHLEFIPRLEEARTIRERFPDAVHACIDITDGLSRDLHHICEESTCGAVVFEDRLPCTSLEPEAQAGNGNLHCVESVLSEGEDFELLLAMEPQAAEELLRGWRQPVPLTNIGLVQPAAEGCATIARNGTRHAMHNVGYEHRA